MQNLQKFAYWIEERERVRLAKEAALSKPWSPDPVFQTVYFCNVRREDDRVTRWIRTNWNATSPQYEFAMCLARQINRISTLSNLVPPWGVLPNHAPDYISYLRTRLDQLMQQRKAIWGNAYLVTTNGAKMPKLDYLLQMWEELYHARLDRDLRQEGITLKLAHQLIMDRDGFANFMAGQVVADLKNTAWHPLAHAEDWWTWSAPGPGSLRGLRWVTGNPATLNTYAGDIADVRAALDEYRGRPFESCMQDLQNCLCEFDKYMRVYTGAGRSKRLYQGVKDD